jgi:hypothetical protein
MDLLWLVKHASLPYADTHASPLLNVTLTSMPLNEALELLRHLRKARSYLEWGSGGSTVLASWLALLPNALLERAISIESSQPFVDSLRNKHEPIRQALAEGKLRYMIGEGLGKTRSWGYPRAWTGSETQMSTWHHQYVALVPPTECCFDVILIDGRFREACALHAMRLSHNKTRVLVHDNDRRPYNRTLGVWYNFERQVGRLSVMRAIPERIAMSKEQAWHTSFSSAMKQPIRM